MRQESAIARVERRIAAVARRQHGVITFTQLLDAGLLPNAITRRVAAGRLHRIHRGVYAVGHRALSDKGRWMAAVLACGEGAVLSHTSAATLWGMLKNVDGFPHVTVPGTGGRARRRGLVIHRSSTLLPSHCTVRTRIPVTNPARTLEDLRRTLPAADFREALRQAQFLRRPIGDRRKADGTFSELEGAFLALCRRHRLPTPEVNARVGRFLVDFLWRERRLVVETDGWEAHGTKSAFEDDRARDVELRLMGYEVLRFTYRQVTEDPAVVAGAVRAMLTARQPM